jgi:cation transport regulator ChaB
MMPYETLPERLRALIPSSEGQEIFRRTFNSQLADGKTEEVAFASAWASLQRAGYERGEDGKWMKKTQPTAAQVHVDGAEWDATSLSVAGGARLRLWATKAPWYSRYRATIFSASTWGSARWGRLGTFKSTRHTSR